MCDNPGNVRADSVFPSPSEHLARQLDDLQDRPAFGKDPVRAVRRRDVSHARRLAMSEVRIQDGLLWLVKTSAYLPRSPHSRRATQPQLRSASADPAASGPID